MPIDERHGHGKGFTPVRGTVFSRVVDRKALVRYRPDARLAVGALVGHLQTGQLDWPLIGLLLLGSAIGITGGSWGAQQVSQATLAKGFAAIAILVAIVMMIHNGMKLVGGSV